MKEFLVYGKQNCLPCSQAKELLDSAGLAYTYIDINMNEGDREFLIKKGLRSVPQIWCDGKYIGGLTQLQEFTV